MLSSAASRTKYQAAHASAACSGRHSIACRPVLAPVHALSSRRSLQLQQHRLCGTADKQSATTSDSNQKPADSSTTSSSVPSSPTSLETCNEPVAASEAPTWEQQERKPKSGRKADSTDPVSTFLTRRFGLGAGLAWLGVLTVGSLGEQIKTRLEVSREEAGTTDVDTAKEVTLPSGVKYTDLRVGGGSTPQKGFLVIVDYQASANGVVFEDTRARNKPIVWIYGGRPFSGGMCLGSELAMNSMKAGGKRRVIVPPELGFPQGAVLRPTEHVPEKQGVIPPNAELTYEIELIRVSIPPS